MGMSLSLGMNMGSAALTSGGGGIIPPYIGQVATRCLVPRSLATGSKQFSTRRYMFARDAIASCKIVLPNWYVNVSAAGVEAGQGGTLTATAAIEYPEGVFTQATFSGVASGVAADGANLTSDDIAVSIPRGAKFFVRLFAEFSNGVLSASGAKCVDTANGDFSRFAASGLTDLTMGGTLTTIDALNTYAPAAIIATTNRKSVYLLGDSLNAGLGDEMDATGNIGILARSVGASYAYISGGISSDRAEWAAANLTKRAALAAYCSNVICELGTNDLFTGTRTAAQVRTSVETLRSLLSTKPFSITTITPRTTSVDNWATVGGQTTSNVSKEAQRVAYNALVRAGNLTGVTGYFEIADLVESARDSGLFKADGSTPFYATVDGTHLSNLLYLQIRNSGVIQL